MRARLAVGIVTVLVAGAWTPVTAADAQLVDGPASGVVGHSVAVPLRAHHHLHLKEREYRPPVSPPCPGTGVSPHFDRPGAAMRYLARAWDARDLDALCHVTEPTGRAQLIQMHEEAVHLRFSRCEFLGVGVYACTFAHDYPRHLHMRGHGRMDIEVAAARTPGWYMSGFMGCG